MRKHYQYLIAVVALAVVWLAGGFDDPVVGAPIVFGAVTGLPERAAIVQREMSQTVKKFRPEYARTLATFQEGTRKKTARLAGLQIGYWKDHAHGQSWYSPVAGDTSFKKSTKQKTGAMFAGIVFRNMNIYLEAHVMQDMERGYIPDSYIQERQRRIATHMMKKNWAAIGDGTGAIAAVSGATGTTITCLANNSARGTSKGVFRLKVSDSTDPLLYDAVNPATDAVVATFYITAKPTSTTATAVFTVGNAAAMDVNTYKICESGSWKKEITGLAGHISDSASRIYQGADTAVDEFLRNESVDAGNAALTPTSIHAAKQVMMTRGNTSTDEDFGYLCHISQINFRDLAKFGYTARSYNAETGKANKTFGLPTMYEDGDTLFVPDADYEDCYVDMREKKPFFEYVQKEFGLKTVGGVSRHEWSGANAVGSTNEYENYNEACNIVWDGRGKDGDGPEGGSPNTSVFIKNIAISTSAQYAKGV
jgi:hypothetical protein